MLYLALSQKLRGQLTKILSHLIFFHTGNLPDAFLSRHQPLTFKECIMQPSLLRSVFVTLALAIVLPVSATAADQPSAPAPATSSQTSTPSGQTAEQPNPAPVNPPPQPEPISKPMVQPVSVSPEISSPVAPAQEIGRPSREHISIGLDFHWLTNSVFRNDYQADSSDHVANTNLTIKPYVGIRTSDLLEIRPALVYVLTSSTYNYTPKSSGTGTEEFTYSFSESRLGFDLGFMFYLIHGSFFRFSVGPALGFDMSLGPTATLKYSDASMDTTIKYNTYVDINIPIHVPFCFDFVPTKHFGFRLSGEILSVVPNIHYSKGNGLDASTVTTVTTLDLTKTLLDFSIGMFLLF
jgi:hypothetical protein